MVLAMQQMGCGQAGAAVLGGMLSIGTDVLKNTWTKLEEAIGAAQIRMANTVINENIEKEKALSKMDDMERYLFCVSIDAGWNNRGSGKSYNSDSCHHITVGNRSGLVVALHYMSKRCGTCESKEKRSEQSTEEVNIDNDEDNNHNANMCPRNYHGSSKGMECTGALKSCLHLHEHHNVVYETIVMDDDSSTENILKWNMQAAFDAKLIDAIPTTASGGKKVDNGQLPFSHPPIERLADINHRNRCMAGKVYKLARLPKYKSECTSADAERLKRNMNSALHQYKTDDFVTFKRMIWAVLYHHFDVHDTCGSWCRSLKYKDNEEELKKLHYRCKTKNSKLFGELKEIWEVYCTDECLKDVHHEWHTNKCESMNMFIAKFIPKRFHLCRTISGKARSYLAVAIDSIGYEATYRTLLPLLQFDYNEDFMHWIRGDPEGTSMTMSRMYGDERRWYGLLGFKRI
jgi:hypothetical protein